MNIFEQASRQKVRFTSIKGELTTEHLWDLPLTSKTGFDLDCVAKATNRELAAVSEDSFVSVKVNPAKPVLELKLEVVKHIIAVRMQDADAAAKAKANSAERQRLLEALDQKRDQELLNLTPEQIQARLKELEG